MQLRLCFVTDEVTLCYVTPLSVANCTSPVKHNEYMSADYFCNVTGNLSALFGEKPISVPLSSPQISHGLEEDLTRTPGDRPATYSLSSGMT